MNWARFGVTALVALVPACVVVQPRDATSKAAAPASEPENGRVAIDDVRARVQKVLSDGTAPEEKLAALADARRELLTRRAPILEEHVRKAKAQLDPKEPEDAVFPTEQTAVSGKEPLGEVGIKLLRSIHHARARLLLSKGAHLEALREVAAGMFGEGSMPLLDCVADEATCADVRAPVVEKWPKLCKGDTSSTTCQWIDEYQLTAAASLGHLPTFVRFTATKVAKSGSSTLVTGADYGPWNSDVCKGRFETNKILDVNERRILIERTTWCKSIENQRNAGRKYVYELPSTSVPVTPGTEVVLLLDKGQVQVKKTGEIENVIVKGAQLVSLDGGNADSFLYGDRMPAALARFPVNLYIH